MVKNRFYMLSKKWRDAKYIKTLFNTHDTNLPRAYGIIKLHKQEKPARLIIPCIDSRVEELSDFYYNILTNAFSCYKK